LGFTVIEKDAGTVTAARGEAQAFLFPDIGKTAAPAHSVKKCPFLSPLYKLVWLLL
jgi:hypothetical protein